MINLTCIVSSLLYQGFKLIGTPYNELSLITKWALQGLAFIVTRGVQSIIFWSFFTLAYLISQNQLSTSQYLLGSWCGFEIIFFLLMRIRYASLKEKSNFIPKSSVELEKFVQVILDNVEDFEEYLGRWLINKPKSLQIEHCREWLTWAFFDKKIEDLTEEEKLQAEQIVDKFRVKLGKCSEPQLIKPEACLRPTLDTVEVNFKPLIFYALMSVPKFFGNLMLLQFGFERHNITDTEINYWTYIPDQIDNEIPIFFIHGVGVGLGMYANLVSKIQQKHPNRRIFLLEVPYVSLDPHAQFTYFTETLLAIDEICQLNNIKQISVIGHSFGTIIVSWLINNRSSLLTQITMVDPVCFNLWDASLAIYTLYSPPFSFLHQICQFFIIQDPVINHAVSRSFQWSQNNLFASQLQVPTRIFYSEYDYIMNTPGLFQQLQTYRQNQSNPQFDVAIHPITHGGYLFVPHLSDLIISDL